MSSMPTPISRKGMMEWRGENSRPIPEQKEKNVPA